MYVSECVVLIDKFVCFFFFFFKQKTAYEIYQCDWSSDVCSSDLLIHSGDSAKNVWLTWYEPAFTQLDAASLRPPAASFEIDPATGKAARGKYRSGSMVIALSGDQTDLARRIDGTVRLFEFMPDSIQTRKELFYAAVEIVADYLPDGLMAGAATLLPVEELSIET